MFQLPLLPLSLAFRFLNLMSLSNASGGLPVTMVRIPVKSNRISTPRCMEACHFGTGAPVSLSFSCKSSVISRTLLSGPPRYDALNASIGLWNLAEVLQYDRDIFAYGLVIAPEAE